MPSTWRLDVRDGPGVLWALCDYFTEGVTASFEGALERFDLLSLPGASSVETDALRRQTRSPRLDFVIVPVTAENIEAIKKRLQTPRTFGRAGDVVDIHDDYSHH